MGTSSFLSWIPLAESVRAGASTTPREATIAARLRDPLELEADLQYPGAPKSRADAGGTTVRRLLDAYARDTLFAEWAAAAAVREWMESYFGERVLMSRAHHNCLMTKHPEYGSMTGWHRDIRYWSFEREDLVSVWFALGEENGSTTALSGWCRALTRWHSRPVDSTRRNFFEPIARTTREIIRTAVSPRLTAGDALFFHCNTLHSAGKNLSDAVKFSLVYTYHGRSNSPRPGTRSASKPEVDLESGS